MADRYRRVQGTKDAVSGDAVEKWKDMTTHHAREVYVAGGTLDLSASGTIQRAAISAASSGDNTLVAAAAGVKTKVLGVMLMASGSVDVRFESGAGGAALSGVISLAADGTGFVLPMATAGYHWLETAANTLLNLELSDAVQVSGLLVYYQEA